LKSPERAKSIQKLAGDIRIKSRVSVVKKVSSEGKEKFVKNSWEKMDLEVIGSLPDMTGS
jgi:CO dehydrogenase nickel-insertion accessory protein CooC1